MSDDHNYHGSDEEYWDDMYYYENNDEDMNPGTWEGNPKSWIGGGFLLWFVILVIVCNISSGLGEAFIILSLIFWIISKIAK